MHKKGEELNSVFEIPCSRANASRITWEKSLYIRIKYITVRNAHCCEFCVVTDVKI
jgi:hypothetical protein